MLQNHILQMLSLIAMEPPISLSPEAIRDEKVQALRSLRPLNTGCVEKNVVKAQYSEGKVKGKKVIGYLQSPGVSENSTTDTFVALKLFIDT